MARWGWWIPLRGGIYCGAFDPDRTAVDVLTPGGSGPRRSGWGWRRPRQFADEGGVPGPPWKHWWHQRDARVTASSGASSAPPLCVPFAGAVQFSDAVMKLQLRRARSLLWSHGKIPQRHQKIHQREGKRDGPEVGGGDLRFAGELERLAAEMMNSDELFRQRGRGICRVGRGEKERGSGAL